MEILTLNLYPDRQDVTLTAYLLPDSREMLRGGSRPAVVVCPGGGYFDCSDKEGEPVALRFAAMGYHAFVLRYSVYAGVTGHPLNPKKPVIPDPRYAAPVQMRELGMALLAIRGRAKKWHVDPDRIAICGFSAGGHNCAMYATHWSKPVITEALGAPARDLRPNAMILGYAATDFLHDDKPGCSEIMRRLDHSMQTVICGRDPATEEDLRRVSPCLLVDGDTPPTFLWATSEDRGVSVRNSLRMADTLATQGIPFEMHIFERGHHGLALAGQASAGDTSDVNPDVAQWVPLAEAWLGKRFALPLPEPRPNPLFEA